MGKNGPGENGKGWGSNRIGSHLGGQKKKKGSTFLNESEKN